MKQNKNIQSIFNSLQIKFRNSPENYFNELLEKTIVVVPSLTLDYEILSKIKGHFYYEERMLCMLMLLKVHNAHITFISSLPISPLIIDYYLHLLPDLNIEDCKKRLTLISCYDAGSQPLTQKILNRPRLIQRIINSLIKPENSHLVCFNVTKYEMELSVKLNLPLYGTDAGLNYLGSKSGCRKLFKTVGLQLPFGFEDIYNVDDICISLQKIYENNMKPKKAVIKINEGFSGDGNAIFSYSGIPDQKEIQMEWIRKNLKVNLKIVAKKLKFKDFIHKIETLGGIVEVFLDGDEVRSPSVQCRIEPNMKTCIISTHDQVMGGESSQVFLGATFPADKMYAAELSQLSSPIIKHLSDLGVLGRFGIDFMSIKKNGYWHHYAIEINLRKGGTTHPFLMLQFLTNGSYNADSGTYLLANGQQRHYFATDNIQSNDYKGLTPNDLLDIVYRHDLHYNHSTSQGIMFHLISALSQYGKIGLVSIADTQEKAMNYYKQVIRILNEETNGS